MIWQLLTEHGRGCSVICHHVRKLEDMCKHSWNGCLTWYVDAPVLDADSVHTIHAGHKPHDVAAVGTIHYLGVLGLATGVGNLCCHVQWVSI